MTPAVNLLNKLKVSHQILQYEHSPTVKAYGNEAVEQLNLPPDQVFKTLVVQTDHNALAVAIVPVNMQLNLKLMAQALNVKKVALAPAELVERNTGYILGGVSPIGQKKPLPTLIDNSALTFKLCYVSGGRRGLELALTPEDLAKTTQATFADLGK